MRRIIFTKSVINRMIQAFLRNNLSNPHIYTEQQVHSLISRPSVLLTVSRGFTSLPDKNRSNGDSPLPSNNFRGIAESVIAKCSNLWVDNRGNGESLVGLSLKDYFLRLSNISPETVRRFWRASILRPQDVLHILLGFEFHCGNYESELENVKSLWGVFQWASKRGRDFQHLPLSCKIMAKMLVRVGMFEEAECLLSRLDGEGILLDCDEVFSDLIEGYVAECDLGRATLNYSRMRAQGLSPSLSCYMSLLDSLVLMNEVQLAHGAFLDMIKVGMARSAAEHGIFENVVRLLCMNGNIQEARDLVKKIYALGIKPNHLVLDAIVGGYCEKMDYDAILSFLVEFRGVTDVAVGNKAIWSLSRNFGSVRAQAFMQEFERFEFCPNKITFGILIGQTCSEGSLRDSFILLSEMLSRNLKPDTDTCNALMSALFKEGLWEQSLDILLEMKDWGMTPSLSTFRVILAGVLKAKRMGEVRAILGLMVDQGLIRFSLPEDYLSTALALLGFDPLAVKVRRDNDVQFSKTQFFDDLGNGLYLETDQDDFDETLIKVLDDAIIPDFNSLVLKNCTKEDIPIALQMVDEMAQWGQVFSASTASTLVNKLSTSQMNIKMLNDLLEKIPYSVYGFDQGALNKLVQKYCKRGYTCKAKMIFNSMLRMKIEIDNNTYSALLISLCKKGDLRSFRKCWLIAREGNWLPELKDGRTLLDRLCRLKLLDEALELIETILMECCCNPMDAFHAFTEKLCCGGLTYVADVLAKELQERGLNLDDVAFNHLLSGFCKDKKLAEAFILVDALSSKKFDPSLISSLQLIHHLCLAGCFDKAILLKDRCLEKHPSALLLVYHALVDGLCKMGMVGEAFNFSQEIMQRQLADDEIYNTLVLGYSRVSDLRRLRELLGIMIRNNITISVSSYRTLVQQECAAGNFSMAWSLQKFMVGQGSLPGISVYNILMFYLLPLQETGVREKLVNEIQDRGLQLDAVAYNLIIQGSANSTDVSRSLSYLETMMSKGFRPSNRSLRKVTGVLLRLGKVEKALELNREMESRGWIPGSVIQTNIVEALLVNGELPEAMKFLDRMVSEGLIPEKVEYTYLIKRLCEHGEVSKGADLLNIMIRKGGSILDSTSFDCMILALCTVDKVDAAMDWHCEMLHRNLTPNSKTWAALVRELTGAGRVSEAEGLLQLMVRRGEAPSKEIYSDVINRYRCENNLRKASEVLRAMQESGHEPDFETHWSLISNFSDPDNKEETGFLSRLLSGIGFSRDR